MKRSSPTVVPRAPRAAREAQPPALRVLPDHQLARVTGGASMVEYALLLVAVT
jgi:hypothetical protein